jgi:putative transposase
MTSSRRNRDGSPTRACSGRCCAPPLMLSVGQASRGDAYDNAMCESFFATLECELLDRHRFQSQAKARTAIFEFIEGRYNPHRRHSALDYQSPIKYERSQLPLI